MTNKDFVTIVANIGTDIMDTSATMKVLIKRYVNTKYFELLRRINWLNINDHYSFDTVVGTQDYVLRDDFGKEKYVFDSTNKKDIGRMTREEWIDKFSEQETDQGAISKYLILDSPVREQPSVASKLTLVSSSDTDKTGSAVIVRIKGFVSGVEVSESMTSNGTTDVLSANTYDANGISAISKASVSVGTFTIDSNTAAKTQAIIAPSVLQCRYKIIRFQAIPATVATIKIPYIQKPMPMSSDYDFPVIDCADIIEFGGQSLAWAFKRQGGKAAFWKGEYEQGVNGLIWDKENQPNQVNMMNPKPYNKDNLY